jgi:hypothetical protein
MLISVPIAASEPTAVSTTSGGARIAIHARQRNGGDAHIGLKAIRDGAQRHRL